MYRTVSVFVVAASLATGAWAQGWLGYGGDAQHSGIFKGTSQSASLVMWSTPIDDDRAYYGGEVLIHYAAPMVTPTNTVVYGYRYTTTVSGQPDYDNWQVIGKTAAAGKTVWSMNTDYSAGVIWPNDWTSVFPITLFASSTALTRGVAAAAGGGSIMVRKSADQASSPVTRLVFYTTLSDYTANASKYAPIKINTPLTSDGKGNIYFGYMVTASIPSSLAALGNGGIACVNTTTGKAIYKAANAMGISTGISRPAMNAAPAITADGKYAYVALSDGGGNNPYLAKLKTSDLSTAAHAELFDPSISGANAILINESSASPMIGPDGNVFMGVFGAQWRESHGWMLQFDSNLSQVNGSGKTYPVGAFGWDDTAVVVPSNVVPSYTGTAKYLILTKYNNYDDNDGDAGADGQNHVAILDPTSNSVSTDRQSGIPVMNEVIKVLGPNKSFNDGNRPNAVCEWCINSAAVDINTKSAIINSEDGHMYRWSFITNSLVEGVNLEPPTGEAYTMTAIGPDGTIYVLNNSVLFAIGSNNATSITTVQGSRPTGSLAGVNKFGGTGYGANAISTPSGQTVVIEAAFLLKPKNKTQLNITSNVTAIDGVKGIMYAYNYTTKKFDLISNATLSGSVTTFTGFIGTGVSNYLAKNGAARIRLQALLSTTVKTPFKFLVNHVTCGSD